MDRSFKSISKASALKGSILVPGDKSISHRALLLGAVAEGMTEITNFAPGTDCLSTVKCLRALGVEIELNDEAFAIVHGRGLHGLRAPGAAADGSGSGAAILDAGNSATTMRLLAGLLAGQVFESRLTGDASLTRRPMGRIIEPLTAMGASLRSENDNGCAPLIFSGQPLDSICGMEHGGLCGQPLHGLTYQTPVASAQVKSCVLLAGLYADGPTTVIEPALSRDHTELMLRGFGADVRTFKTESRSLATHNDDDQPVVKEAKAFCAAGTFLAPLPAVTLTPGRPLIGQKINVPGDISSAAYFMAAGLLVPGSDIILRNVGINPTRAGIFKVIEMMGGQVELSNRHELGEQVELSNRRELSEPAADIRVTSCALHGTVIGGELIPTLIDELPIISIMAVFAEGETIIRDSAELRVKESDRLALIAENLAAMGADVTMTDDGLIIRGRPIPSETNSKIAKPSSSTASQRSLHGARIRTLSDHRIAMAFAIAGLLTGDMEIDDPECVAASYPGFFKAIDSLTS